MTCACISCRLAFYCSAVAVLALSFGMVLGAASVPPRECLKGDSRASNR